MNITKREKRLIVFAMAVIIAGSAAKWMIIPEIMQFNKIQKQLITLKGEAEANDYSLYNEQKLLDALQREKTTQKDNSKYFYSGQREESIIFFAEEVEKLFRKNEIKEINKNIETIDEENITKMAYTIRLEGTFGQISNLVVDLENIDKLKIKRLDLRPVALGENIEGEILIQGIYIKNSEGEESENNI